MFRWRTAHRMVHQGGAEHSLELASPLWGIHASMNEQNAG